MTINTLAAALQNAVAGLNATGVRRATTQPVQQLRGQADQSIAGAVAQANQDLSQLASLNQQAGPGVAPALFDQQDAALKDLAQQIGISFNRGANGQVQVFTQ